MAAYALVAVAGIAGLLLLVAPAVVSSAAGTRALLGALERASGLRLEVSRLSVDWSLRVLCEGLEVADDRGRSLLRASRLELRLAAGRWRGGRIGRLEVEDFEITRHERAERRSPAGRGGDGRGRRLPAYLPLGEIRLLRGAIGTAAGTHRLIVPEVALLAPADGPGWRTHGRIEVVEVGDGGTVRDRGALAWRGRTGADGRDVELTGELVVAPVGAALAALGVAEPAIVGDVSLTANASVIGVLGETLHVELDGDVEHPELRESARLDAKIDVDVPRRSAAIDAGFEPGAGVPRLGLDGVVRARRAGGRVALDLDLDWPDVALAALAPLAASPPPWLSGLDRLDGRVELRSSVAGRVGRPRLRGSLQVTGLEASGAGGEAAIAKLTVGKVAVRFASAELVMGEIVVEGLAASDEGFLHVIDEVRLGGRLRARRLEDGGGEISLEAATDAGELLWERVYADLADHPLAATATIRSGDDGGLDLDELELVGTGLGRAAGGGHYRRGQGLEWLELELAVPRLAPLYELLVREPLAESYPAFARAKAGGALHGRLRYQARGGRFERLSGRLRVQDGRLELVDPPSTIAGLDLDLPVNIAVGAGAGGSERGSLAIGRSTVRGVALPALDLPLRVRSGEVSIAGTIEVPLFGGRLEIGNLHVAGLGSADPRVGLWMAAHEIDAGLLTSALALPVAAGRLEGRLERIEGRSGSIVTEGEVALEVLGGRVAFGDMRVSRLLSRVPTLHVDIAARGIDLRQATQSLGVGYVSGVLDATIDDLEIAAGQAVRFDAVVESVPTRGIKQRVSVTAIEQLSVLGGGGGDPVSRRILGFFDEYRYAKLGLRCSLRNDRFALRGIEETDGKDFLVIGTFMPPTVNVVSHNQVIAFGEMTRRLSRIVHLGGDTDEPDRE